MVCVGIRHYGLRERYSFSSSEESIFSIGSLCGLSAVVIVKTIHAFGDTEGGVAAGIMAALLVGALAGVIHGFVITKFKVPAFLVTFATSSIFLGLSMVLTNNKIISCLG